MIAPGRKPATLVRAAWIFALAVLLLREPLRAETSADTDSALRSAAEQINLRHFAQAAELLRQALQNNPQSAKANNLLGVCQLQAGEAQKARASFERSIELDDKFAAAYVNLGNLLLKGRNEAEAFKAFKTALAIDPLILGNDPSSYANFNIWGLCLMDARNYREAQQAFRRSIRINPRFAPARVNLGRAFLLLNQEDAALREFLASLPLAPEDYLTRYNVGLIYARQGKLSLAAKFLQQAQAMAPGDKAVAFALMGAELKRGNQSEAESILASLGGWSPPDTSARETVSLLWLGVGKPAAGAQITRGDETASRYYYDTARQKAEEALGKGEYAEAARTLEAVRDLEPADGAFHDLLGSVYYGLGKPQEAFDEFNAAVRLEPADPDYQYKLGMVFLRNNTPDPAINVFETATKIRPDVPKLWLGLGLSYYFASRLGEAEKALRVALALDSEYQPAYIVLGDLLYQSGRADDAVALLRQAVDLQPDWFFPYYYYGVVALRRSQVNPEEILQALRRAIALNPQFPEAHCELGKAFARAGQPAEAIRELERSLDLKPGLTESHYQLGVIYRQLGNGPRASEQFALFAQAKEKNNPVDVIRAQLESFAREKHKNQNAVRPERGGHTDKP